MIPGCKRRVGYFGWMPTELTKLIDGPAKVVCMCVTVCACVWDNVYVCLHMCVCVCVRVGRETEN